MKIIYCCIFFAFLVSCTRQTKTSETPVVEDTVIQPVTEVEDTTSTNEDSDCVFNDDNRTLTTEWAKELQMDNFTWRDDIERVVVPRGQDTIYLGKGGCSHFGISVELKLGDESRDISDSTYFIGKALALAEEFGMDQYEKMIKAGRVRKIEESELSVWYQIEDDSEGGNVVYDGIGLSTDGRTRTISISLYFN